MKRVRWLALVGGLALVAVACGTTADTTTTTAGETPDTTAAAQATTTTVEAEVAFEGLVLDSGGCSEGGSKVDKITAVDELTVQFDLCSSDPAFLAKIAFGVFGIQPAEHLQATGGAPLDNPIGTGPYAITEWVRGDSVVYERFDDYYGAPAFQQTAVLRWATEGAQRLLELQSGNVDGITFPSTDDYPVIADDPNLELLIKPEPNIFYIGFTNTFPPFDNADVRRAVALGVDRQRIVDTFYPEGSEVASHFTPCSVTNGCEGEAFPTFDLETAKTLLADAGFPDGFDTTIYYRDVFRGYLPEPGAVANDIAAQLAENLNINAEVVVMESGEFIQASTQGELDGIHLLGWTGDYPHITNFLDFHFNENNPQFGDPWPDIYENLDVASKQIEPDPALYAAANEAINENIPMVPVVHSVTAFAAGADVEGTYAPPWGQVLLSLWDNGGDTIVFMQGNEPISLYCSDESDGESLRGCAQVVEALYSYSTTGEVQPQLATECTANDDLTVYVCTLRDGVLFHDGSLLDANDVVVSFTAGLDAASPLHVGNSGAFDYYAYLWDNLINAEE